MVYESEKQTAYVTTEAVNIKLRIKPIDEFEETRGNDRYYCLDAKLFEYIK